ncbi:MAG: hypothetical protein ACRD1L_00945 [Terriglobales bacterium]
MTIPPEPLAAPGSERLAPLSALGGETAASRTPAHGWQALRQRWNCMGPECNERNVFRAWVKRRPARLQLQQGWCCSPECFEAAFERLARPLLGGLAAPRRARPHRVPLGLLLLSHGTITSAQLRQALAAQQACGQGRVGEWLVRQGSIREDEVAAGVALQWARPTFPLAQSQSWHQCRGWAPRAVLEALNMLPLHFAAQQRRLYVGFTQTVDTTALAALAYIFECKTEACIVTDSSLHQAFEQMRALPELDQIQEVALERTDNPHEIAGMVRQYARYAEARQVRVASAGPFLWVHIRGGRVVHLTFKIK